MTAPDNAAIVREALGECSECPNCPAIAALAALVQERDEARVSLREIKDAYHIQRGLRESADMRLGETISEIARLREALEWIDKFIAFRFREGDAEYQVCIIARTALNPSASGGVSAPAGGYDTGSRGVGSSDETVAEAHPAPSATGGDS